MSVSQSSSLLHLHSTPGYLRCGHIGQLALPGLRADKAPVVAGGLSVLLALFHTLQLQAMVPAQGALRIGVLHSLCNPTG